MDSDGTYIRVKKSTRERLGNIGTKKDSYDSVINMLIDQYTEHGICSKEQTR